MDEVRSPASPSRGKDRRRHRQRCHGQPHRIVYLPCHARGRRQSLAKIIQLVEDANATKAPIARMADKVAGVFCARGVCDLGRDLCGVDGADRQCERGAHLRRGRKLVIDCPCALGTPRPSPLWLAPA